MPSDLVSKEKICEVLNCDEDRLDDLMRNRQDFPHLIYNEGTDEELIVFPLQEVLALKIKPFKKKVVKPREEKDPFEAPVKPEPKTKPKAKPKTTKK